MPRLTRTEASLPATWYFDDAHYTHELEAVWYREWVCVGRLEEIANPGDFFIARIGTQSLIVTRDRDGAPRAFHNTCRHRGSILCAGERGHFAGGRIVCPYHSWTYSLTGELVATPVRLECEDFHVENYPLYAAHIGTWGGYLFVNLAEAPAQTLQEFLGHEAGNVESWPLAEMVTVQRDRTTLACNWKIFWENYSECYHCPRIHPELCRIVPLYKRGTFTQADFDGSKAAATGGDGQPRLAAGYRTWTMDGQSRLPEIAGAADALDGAGMAFASFTGSMFIVAHVDYVRSVHVLPRGPEEIEINVTWLLPRGAAETCADGIHPILELGRLIVQQDGQVCEINQRGQKSRRHEAGVLVPQEWALHEFHQWLRDRLAT
jgi:Rieske 2Fe-2S family protein